MGDIAAVFGVEWPKLIAQIIIVVIVYAILKAKVFGPVLGMLETRRSRIEEGEQNLEKTRADLARAEERSNAIVAEANAEANRMIAEAKESAAAAGEKKKQEAVAEAAQIVAKGREATALERESQLTEMKRDFGRLVIDATSKVTGKVLTDEDQARINQETAQQIAL
ncbi:hypothetical protein BH23VER1_BH23VER1_02700 [soil metagenome]